MSQPFFGMSWGYESCPPPVPTIVEEHHYYAPSAVPQDPFLFDPIPATPAPVLPPAQLPPVYRGQVEIEDQPVLIEPCEECIETPFGEEKIWAPTLAPFQLRFEIDHTEDKDEVARTGFGLVANATRGLGIDTGVRLFREQGVDFRDHLWNGDFNVTYELSATKAVRTRAGIGFNFLADRFGSDFGLNLTLGSEVFWGPAILSGTMDVGSVGDADLFHARVAAAIRCGDHAEPFMGYDYLDIGGVEFSSIVAGLRFRY